MKTNYRVSFGFAVLALTAFFTFTGCRSVPGFSYNGMVLTAKEQNPKILNLRNYGDGDTPYYQQSENLMKNGFLDTSSEEYGYYYIYFKDEALNNHKNSILYYVNFLGLSILFGSPTDHEFHNITVYLDIFNSNGEQIKTFETFTSTMDLYAGLYYGYKKGTQKKAEQFVSGAVADIQKKASAESAEINRLLKEAGPINADKDEAAQNKISQAIKPKLYKWYRVDEGSIDSTYISAYDSSGKTLSSSSDTTRYESSTTSASSSSPSTSAPGAGGSAQATLRDGTYQMSGSNNSLEFNTTLKSVEMTVGGKAIARGSYQINGSTLSVTFTSYYGDAADRDFARKQFDGKTFVYTLAGDSSFSGNGETWTRTGF